METIAAIITNGEVSNLIVVDPNDLATINHFGAIVLPQGHIVQIGDSYDGTTFTSPIVPILPNTSGFIQACKNAFGGPIGILSLPSNVQSAISLTISAISLQDWSDVQIYITSMEVALGPTTYSAIKTAATSNNIPVVL